MLGTDFILRHQVQTDFGRGYLVINGQNIELYSRHHLSRCRRVLIRDDTTIPPRTQLDVAIHVPLSNLNDTQDTWLLQSKQVKPGLVLASTVLPGHINDVTRLCNLSNMEQRLPMHTLLARAVSAEVVQPTTPDTIADRTETVANIIAKITSSLPAAMTEEQRTNVIDLLWRYEQVFTISEFDLGYTDILKH
jgi:RecG-like helicase